MVDGFFFAVWSISVGMKRQKSDGFRQYPHAGVDRGGLQRRPLVDRLAAGAGAEEKAVCAAEQAVFRLISCFEQAGKDIHRHHSPENWHEKSTSSEML